MSEAREDLAALEKVRSLLCSRIYVAHPLLARRTTRRSPSRPTTVKRTWNTRRRVHYPGVPTNIEYRAEDVTSLRRPPVASGERGTVLLLRRAL